MAASNHAFHGEKNHGAMIATYVKYASNSHSDDRRREATKNTCYHIELLLSSCYALKQPVNRTASVWSLF